MLVIMNEAGYLVQWRKTRTDKQFKVQLTHFINEDGLCDTTRARRLERLRTSEGLREKLIGGANGKTRSGTF